MIVSDIICHIEQVASLAYQEKWDNCGMQVGSLCTDVRSCLVCVDITEDVIDEAIQKGCQLIISHHPLLFHPLRKIDETTSTGRCVIKAIKNDMAIYSSHTAMDKYVHGVSGRMAEMLGIVQYEILQKDEGSTVGFGVIGELPESYPVSDFLERVKDVFLVSYLLYACPKSLQRVRKVALCGGAGGDSLDTAVLRHADAFVTADLGYHRFETSKEELLVVSMDHWSSEHFVVDVFTELLPSDIVVVKSERDKSPIEMI